MPSGSRIIDLQDTGPGQGKRAILREQMIDLVRDLEDLISSAGMPLSRASTVLKVMRRFLDTADVYGLSRPVDMLPFSSCIHRSLHCLVQGKT